MEVQQTETFQAWLASLKDKLGRAAIVARLMRLEDGNFGAAQPLGAGLTELRIHMGPGYRVYVSQRGKGQQRDIKMAIKLADAIEEADR